MTGPHTGEVKALVGGRDASLRRLQPRARRAAANRLADQARRLSWRRSNRAAIRSRASSTTHRSSSSSIGATLGRRRNFDDQAHGLVPLVRALAESYNMATVRLGLDVGLEPIADTLQRLGLAAETDAVSLDAARRARVDADRGRADLQHARQRRLPRTAARRAQRRRRGRRAAAALRDRDHASRRRRGRLRAESGARASHGARHGPHRAPACCPKISSSPARPARPTTCATVGSQASRTIT